MKCVILLLIWIDFILSFSPTSGPESFFFTDYFPLPVSRWTDTSFQIFHNSRFSRFLMSDFGITSIENGLESFFYSLPNGCFLREDSTQVFYFNPRGKSHFVTQKSPTTRVIPLFSTENLLKIELNSSCDRRNNSEYNQKSECFSFSVLNIDGKQISSYGQVTGEVPGTFNWTFERIYAKGNQIFINLLMKSENHSETKYLMLRLVPTPENRLQKSLSIIGIEKELRYLMTEFSIESTSPKYQFLYTIQGGKYILFKWDLGGIEESLRWIFEDCRMKKSKQEKMEIIDGSRWDFLTVNFRTPKYAFDLDLYLREGKLSPCDGNSIPFQIVKIFRFDPSAPPHSIGERSIGVSYGHPIYRQFFLTYHNRKLYNFSPTYDGLKGGSVFSTINIPQSPDKEWILKSFYIDVEKSNKINFIFSDQNHSIWINDSVELFPCSEFSDCSDCETIGAVLGCEWSANGKRQCTYSHTEGNEYAEKPFRCFRERGAKINRGSKLNVTIELDHDAKPREKPFFRVKNQLFPAVITECNVGTCVYEGVLPEDTEHLDLLIYQLMGPPLVYAKNLWDKRIRDRSIWFIISGILWFLSIVCLFVRWKINEIEKYFISKFTKSEPSSEDIEMAQTEMKTRVPDADEQEIKDDAI